MPEMPVRLIWSLSNSGLGTTLGATAGNSGAYQTPAVPPWTPNALSAIDLRYIEDVWLTAFVTTVGGTGTPTLTVVLNVFDDLGNKFLITGSSITATASGTGSQISLGKHGGAASNYNVFPAWGQVAWSATGTTPTFTGTEISLWCR